VCINRVESINDGRSVALKFLHKMDGNAHATNCEECCILGCEPM
jgi:hypothetical protein